jgi:hypothetical protein
MRAAAPCPRLIHRADTDAKLDIGFGLRYQSRPLLIIAFRVSKRARVVVAAARASDNGDGSSVSSISAGRLDDAQGRPPASRRSSWSSRPAGH